jgi:hypothetical protein
MSSKYKPLLKPWTPEEDGLLLQLARTMTFEQIVHADAIPGRNKNAMIGRFNRLTNGKPKRDLSATDIGRRKRSNDPPLPAEAGGTYRPLHCKSIWDLDARDCRYPFDAPKGSAVGFVFCGEPIARGSKYCKHHAFCMIRSKLT